MQTGQSATEQHEAYMRICINLATAARHRGDSPVGSIVVLDGRVIGEGIEGGKTHKDITHHAEIEAIRQANVFLGGQDLSGCTLYTTHEPCIMCSYIIRHARIATVVMGVYSGAIGGYSSRYPLLSDTTITTWGPPPMLVAGVLQQECTALYS